MTVRCNYPLPIEKMCLKDIEELEQTVSDPISIEKIRKRKEELNVMFKYLNQDYKKWGA